MTTPAHAVRLRPGTLAHAPPVPAHRQLIIVRGTRTATRAAAVRALQPFPTTRVAWVSDADGPPDPFAPATRSNRARQLLGQSLAALVYDLHDTLNADHLGQLHGVVLGRGALILRLPDTPLQSRFGRRLENAITRYQHAHPTHGAPQRPWTDASRHGTAQQQQLVQALVDQWSTPAADSPAPWVIIADRGRGKSSALGLALAQLPPSDWVVTGPHPDACAQVTRFAERERFVPATKLAWGATANDNRDAPAADAPPNPRVIVVDEAAQLPLPILQRIVAAHPDAHLAFATTAHGYEGTGRGFALRFVRWLGEQRSHVITPTLDEPVRWSAGDPLEAFIHDLLLLESQPPRTPEFAAGTILYEKLSPDRIAHDEPLLRSVFGLLIQAHYRTRPSDLQQILDAPNLHIHVARAQGAPTHHILGACLVSEEGGLDTQTTDDLFWGRRSIRGHALPETLVAHLGHRDAGALSYVRSVRIATHPDARRRGIASGLVTHVHAHYAPDFFGTLHGADVGVLSFRRQLGYRLVRVSAARGARTGEPAVAMLAPRTPRAHSLLERARRDLARDLPVQLELFRRDGVLDIHPTLQTALLEGLQSDVASSDTAQSLATRSAPTPPLLAPSAPTPPRPTQWNPERLIAYTHGPRTFESVAPDVIAFCTQRQPLLRALDDDLAELVRARALRWEPWETCRAVFTPTASYAATMRALRRAVRALVEHSEPQLIPKPPAR